MFPHRGLTIQGIRLDASTSADLASAETLRFLFITEGCGALNGGELSAQEPLEALELSAGTVDQPA